VSPKECSEKENLVSRFGWNFVQGTKVFGTQLHQYQKTVLI
jgi:hypothetical protein